MSYFLFILFDLYIFSGIYSTFKKPLKKRNKIIIVVFWVLSILTYVVPSYYRNQDTHLTGQFPYSFMFSMVIGIFIVKFFYFLSLIFNDAFSLGRYGFRLMNKNLSKKNQKDVDHTSSEDQNKVTLSRSQFLLKSGAFLAAAPAAGMTFGITSGAHDYRVRKTKVKIKDLPKSLEGIKIGQISDIHAGSFWNKTAVSGGIDLLNSEKPDLVCFTGDLVNNVATEMNDYINVFNKIKADLGVYSVIGNHDYGNYVVWDSDEAKSKNFDELKKMHSTLGWNLLLNENKILDIQGEKLGLIGVENWSINKRFPSSGNLPLAKNGTNDVQTKILLSHDPTHWRGEILKGEHPDIDLMLSGHTHGMQLGVETENFKWSPVQYIYEEWAGLYTENNQHLYVNRGYGYLGFPGRLGILPEITILELTRA